MPIIKTIITFCFFFFFSEIAPAQVNCGTKDDKPVPGAIFGPDRLWAYGPDTVVTKTGMQIVYFCDSCKLNGYNAEGRLKWSKDLTAHHCRLATFSFFNCRSDEKIMGGDILLQFIGATSYSLNSKSGKMRLVTEADMERHNMKMHLGFKIKPEK